MLRLSAALGVLALMMSLSGCTTTLAFNPVEGPLASQTPRPIYTAQVSPPVPDAGASVAVALGQSEVFKGAWQIVDPINAAAASSPELEHAWDFVYGAGYYRAHVLGSNFHERALLNGAAGSTAIIEMLSDGRGVARDSHANVYKVFVAPRTIN